MIAKVHLRSSRYVFEMTPDPLGAIVEQTIQGRRLARPRRRAQDGESDNAFVSKFSSKEEAFLEGSNLLNQPELKPTGAPTQANGTNSTTTKLYSARSVSQKRA